MIKALNLEGLDFQCMVKIPKKRSLLRIPSSFLFTESFENRYHIGVRGLEQQGYLHIK